MSKANITITFFPSQTVHGSTIYQAYRGRAHLATTIQETEKEAVEDLIPKVLKKLGGLAIGKITVRPHSAQPPEEKEPI